MRHPPRLTDVAAFQLIDTAHEHARFVPAEPLPRPRQRLRLTDGMLGEFDYIRVPA